MTDDSQHNLPFRVGEVLLGKYRIERVLGVGGMGVVVAAMHLDLDTQVAIKVMRGELLSEPSAVQRLLLEARAAAKIKSEHVARVLDVGTLPDGAPYIVMEFLEGCDLGQLLQRQGALAVSQAVDFLLEACEALAEAHAAQIIHRDLKPENLFVARRADGLPTIKVVDFGISKQIGASAQGRALTNPSTAVGSPQYMAPEQMQSRGVDQRADIWALGTILYQVVSGRHAFDGQTLPEVCAKVLGQEPASLRSVRSDLPQALEEIVERCLKKDPTQRFANVAALAMALAPLGTPNAQRSLERITRVLQGSNAAMPVHSAVAPKPGAQSGFEPTVAAQTPMAGSATFAGSGAQASGRPARWLIPTILAAAVLAAALAVMLMRGADATAPSASESAMPSPVPASQPAQVSAEPPAPSKPVEPEPSEPAASAAPSAAATAPAATAPTPAPKLKPRPVTKPKPTPAKEETSSGAQKAWDTDSFGGRR